MKLIKVLSFICALCFALALVGFSGAWGQENETYIPKLEFSISDIAPANEIHFYSQVPCTTPSNPILVQPTCQKKVGTLYLTDPISFEGQVDKSAEVFFQYVIKNIIKCKEAK